MGRINEMKDDFVKAIVRVGIVNPREQENLREIAERCVKYGIPLGGAMAAMGAKAGTITVPGVGTISGAAAGFLVGLLGGSGMCVMVNFSVNKHIQKELKELSDKWSKPFNR